MNKYEYKVKSDEIKALIDEGEIYEAADIADTIDWRRVKSVVMLCTIGNLYKDNHRYEDAKDIFLLAYNRRPGWRDVCYSLCELCLKTDDYVSAVEFYKEFVKNSPRDPGRYILQYKLYEAQDISLEERIDVLEELKQHDYTEKWAYELAYLYHRIGLGARCVDECDELILSFGEGKYVKKALELKMLHEPLTPRQQALYESFGGVSKGRRKASAIRNSVATLPSYDRNLRTGRQSAISRARESRYLDEFQDEYTDNRRDRYADDYKDEYTDRYADEYRTGYPDERNERYGLPERTEKAEGRNPKKRSSARYERLSGRERRREERKKEERARDERSPGSRRQGGNSGQYDDRNRYNDRYSDESYEDDYTQNPYSQNPYEQGAYEQAAYGQDLYGQDSYGQDVYGQDVYAQDSYGQDSYGQEPYETPGYGESYGGYNADTENTRVYEPVRDEQLYSGQSDEEPPFVENDYDIQIKPMDMGRYNTLNLQAELAEGLKEVLDDEEEQKPADPVMQDIMAPMLEEDTEEESELPAQEVYPVVGEEVSSEYRKEPEYEMSATEVFFGETGELADLRNVPDYRDERVPRYLEESSRMGAMTEALVRSLSAQPPARLAGVLSQESDGQISFVMPEGPQIEKQITGQLNIDDVIAEWERIRQENAEKSTEQVINRVKQTTGELFTEFEAAVRDGLLEQIERESDQEEQYAREGIYSLDTADDRDIIDAEYRLLPEEGSDAAYPEEGEVVLPEDTVIDANPEETEAEEEEPSVESVKAQEEAQEDTQDEAQKEVQEGMQKEASEEPAPSEDAVESEDDEEGDEADDSDDDSDSDSDTDTSQIRALTREEKEAFAPYIQRKSSKKQLIGILDNASMDACTSNIILTGEEGTDTLTLAKNIVREIRLSDANFSGRVAKISGGSLNTKDVEGTITQLSNGALIIEHAGQMTNETVSRLDKALQNMNNGIVVLLEDSRKNIKKLLSDNKGGLSSFTNRMDVKALNNDALVEFGKQYARDREYTFDELGILALHTKIDERQTLDHAVTVLDVKEIVDKAIANASKKSVGHFFDVIMKRRYDEEDMIVLGEKDFE
ncbi:MAG: hypothetical protein IJ608_11375 [Lachnospiraceae bacterium]|nr:hypothetical protein [Lachnospiraceae bacterium]